MADHNYWLLGARWFDKDDNKIDKENDFITNNVWILGYKKDGDLTQYNDAKQIKVGDRVAIKRNHGFADKPITIFSIGIVTGVTHDADRIICVINWIDKTAKEVELSKGCVKTVNGPYKKDKQYEQWLNEIFSL